MSTKNTNLFAVHIHRSRNRNSKRICNRFPVLAFIIISIAFTGTFCTCEAAGTTPAKVVEIVKPISGWSGDRILELEAKINDPGIDFAYLVENGNERRVRVREGKVSEKLVLSPGSNHIIVQVEKNGTIYSDWVNLFSDVPKKDIKIILTWDTDGTDVDLHVVNPSGVECYYANRETKEGGKLDVDIVDGYGPEVFTQTDAGPGEYRVFVYYYSSNDKPQTVATVQVILFEGTDMEKKYYFQKVLVKTNDSSDVGNFNVQKLEREKN